MLDDKAIARVKCQELKKLVGDELSIVATFLHLLMEFSRDKRHEQLGFASLWDFCRKGLGLCESTTGRRLKAIKVIERFPAAVDYLRDGRLCVTRLLLLADVLTTEWQLEADHVEAVAKGGKTNVSSARSLCRKHNDQHARETFGEAFMAAKKRASKVATGVASSSGGD